MTLEIIQALGSLIVLAEALNKLHRADLFDGKRGLWPRLGGMLWLATPWRWKVRRAVQVLAMLAWALLSVAAFQSLITSTEPSLQAALAVAGCATLIVRSRIKESYQ